MPIQIDEVQSDVTVRSRGAETPQGQDGNLPDAEEMHRWVRLARRLAWDEARTRAIDCDD